MFLLLLILCVCVCVCVWKHQTRVPKYVCRPVQKYVLLAGHTPSPWMLKHRFPLSDSDRGGPGSAFERANGRSGYVAVTRMPYEVPYFIGRLLARHALLPLLSPDFLALRSVIGRELDVVQVMK